MPVIGVSLLNTMSNPVPHCFEIRVYYEDTDLAGVVYYANYLRFIERARSEWVRALGIDQTRLKREHDTVFAVYKLDATYLKPARFDDLIEVQTQVVEQLPARLVLQQSVLCEAQLLFDSQVTLVCMSNTGRPKRLPAELRAALSVST